MTRRQWLLIAGSASLPFAGQTAPPAPSGTLIPLPQITATAPAPTSPNVTRNSVAYYIAGLKDEDPTRRLQAIRALGALRDPRAAGPLADQLLLELPLTADVPMGSGPNAGTGPNSPGWLAPDISHSLASITGLPDALSFSEPPRIAAQQATVEGGFRDQLAAAVRRWIALHPEAAAPLEAPPEAWIPTLHRDLTQITQQPGMTIPDIERLAGPRNAATATTTGSAVFDWGPDSSGCRLSVTGLASGNAISSWTLSRWSAATETAIAKLRTADTLKLDLREVQPGGGYSPMVVYTTRTLPPDGSSLERHITPAEAWQLIEWLARSQFFDQLVQPDTSRPQRVVHINDFQGALTVNELDFFRTARLVLGPDRWNFGRAISSTLIVPATAPAALPAGDGPVLILRRSGADHRGDTAPTSVRGLAIRTQNNFPVGNQSFWDWPNHPPAPGNVPMILLATNWSGRIWSTFTIDSITRQGHALHVNVHATYASANPGSPLDGVSYSYVLLPEIPPGEYDIDVTYNYFETTSPETPIKPPAGYPASVKGKMTLPADYTAHFLPPSGYETAKITWHVDQAGHFDLNHARRATVVEPAAVERLSQLFLRATPPYPDGGPSQPKINAPANVWLAAVEIDLLRPDGKRAHIVIDADLKAWSQGNGDYSLAGDLARELAAITWDKPPATSPAEDPWGDPVRGRQLRLGPVNTVWNVASADIRKAPPGVQFFADRNPLLHFDTRNVGNQTLAVPGTYQFTWLEWDGKLYSPSNLSSGLMGMAMPPGQSFSNLDFPINEGWSSTDVPKLILTPGKHVVRMAESGSTTFLSSDAERKAQMIFSNPVTIEILP